MKGNFYIFKVYWSRLVTFEHKFCYILFDNQRKGPIGQFWRIRLGLSVLLVRCSQSARHSDNRPRQSHIKEEMATGWREKRLRQIVFIFFLGRGWRFRGETQPIRDEMELLESERRILSPGCCTEEREKTRGRERRGMGERRGPCIMQKLVIQITHTTWRQRGGWTGTDRRVWQKMYSI